MHIYCWASFNVSLQLGAEIQRMCPQGEDLSVLRVKGMAFERTFRWLACLFFRRGAGAEDHKDHAGQPLGSCLAMNFFRAL